MGITAESNSAVVGGMKLHYESWGRRGLPPVLLVHGLRAYGKWFEALGSALSDRYFIVAPDLRGRNLSDWAKDGNYTIDAYVADLEGLAHHLGLSRFALGGHSLGGAIVAAYTARHPNQIAALILFDYSPEPETSGVTRIMAEVARTPEAFPSREAARDFLRTLHPHASSDHLETRLGCMLSEGQDGTLRWRIDRACTRPALDPPEKAWAALRGIPAPTLHLRGARSDVLGAHTCAKMVAAVPSSRSVEIDAAGHMVLEDNPLDCLAAIEAFLHASYPTPP
jgi:esterase